MAGMSSSFGDVLRRKLGDPVVDRDVWDAVDAVGEGDEAAYLHALASIASRYGESELYYVIRDRHTPGSVLEGLFFAAGGWRETRPRLFACDIALVGCSMTRRIERAIMSGGDIGLLKDIAGNPHISDETVDDLLRLDSTDVYHRMLANRGLGGRVLRDVERRLRDAGEEIERVATSGYRNNAMPVDVVMSWADSGGRAREVAMMSPVMPRDALADYFLSGAWYLMYEAAKRVFASTSNADGSLIDWYVKARLCKSDSRDNVGGALEHPHAWQSTLERAYVQAGRDDKKIAMALVRAPTCPEWVRRDVLSLGDSDLVVEAAWSVGASPDYARFLMNAGYVREASYCRAASGDTLRELVARSGDWSGEWPARVATHGGLPPDVRRGLAPWFPESLWLVARDRFLGRAA